MVAVTMVISVFVLFPFGVQVALVYRIGIRHEPRRIGTQWRRQGSQKSRDRRRDPSGHSQSPVSGSSLDLAADLPGSS
jgi:hypothetical protein